MMRTNVVLDDDLVEEAFALTGVRTKRELVRLALEELIRARKKKNLFDLAKNCPVIGAMLYCPHANSTRDFALSAEYKNYA